MNTSIFIEFCQYLSQNPNNRLVQELKRNPLLIPSAEEIFRECGHLWQEPEELYEQLFRSSLRQAKIDVLEAAIRSILNRSAFVLRKDDSFNLLDIVRAKLSSMNITAFKQVFGIPTSHAEAPIKLRDIIIETGLLTPQGIEPTLFNYFVGGGMYDYVQKTAHSSNTDFPKFLREEIVRRMGDPLWHEPLRHFTKRISGELFDDLVCAFLHPKSDTSTNESKQEALRIMVMSVGSLELKKTQTLLLTEPDAGPEWQCFFLNALRWEIGNPYLISREDTLQQFIDQGNAALFVIKKAQGLLDWAKTETGDRRARS